ncbi:MAG: hypothetical protein LBQ87_02105, partial [Candidatus Fibromonas sp.]|jgi:hypothetical protein|nr:hypothetical protein [Candidatus Fibromonas sp.]
LGKDGGYYSFIGYKTKLKQWLTDLLLNPTVEKLINVSNDSITIDFGTDYVSIKIDRREFITDNFETLKKELHGTPYISSLIGWLEYYYCGNSKKGIYPDMGVAGFSENNSDGNNYYMFSQTDKGYILTGVAIRNDKLKLNADTRRNIRKESCYAECRD